MFTWLSVPGALLCLWEPPRDDCDNLFEYNDKFDIWLQMFTLLSVLGSWLCLRGPPRDDCDNLFEYNDKFDIWLQMFTLLSVLGSWLCLRGPPRDDCDNLFEYNDKFDIWLQMFTLLSVLGSWLCLRGPPRDDCDNLFEYNDKFDIWLQMFTLLSVLGSWLCLRGPPRDVSDNSFEYNDEFWHATKNVYLAVCTRFLIVLARISPWCFIDSVWLLSVLSCWKNNFWYSNGDDDCNEKFLPKLVGIKGIKDFNRPYDHSVIQLNLWPIWPWNWECSRLIVLIKVYMQCLSKFIYMWSLKNSFEKDLLSVVFYKALKVKTKPKQANSRDKNELKVGQRSRSQHRTIGKVLVGWLFWGFTSL